MPLTSGQAATRADAFCTDQGITDSAAKAHWEALFKAIYAALLSDATVTVGIPVATTGSPSAQTGATTAPGTLT
jgi:hypothetical protein